MAEVLIELALEGGIFVEWLIRNLRKTNLVRSLTFKNMF